MKAFSNTFIDQMHKLRPVVKHLILKAFWQYLLNLLCHMRVLKTAQYFILDL